MARVSGLEPRSEGKLKRHRTDVVLRHAVFHDEGGLTVLHLQTAGSLERKHVGVTSQTLQLGRNEALALREVITKAFHASE